MSAARLATAAALLAFFGMVLAVLDTPFWWVGLIVIPPAFGALVFMAARADRQERGGW